jgi:NTE family protein
MGKSHYVYLMSAVAQHAPELENLMKAKTLIGGLLGYSYDSMFGPLGLSVGYSNRTKTPYFYFNFGYEL